MTETPSIPSVSTPTARRLWAKLHRLLARFSKSYCSWFSIQFTPPIFQLPFGLILKWSDRTRVEEAVSMQMARAAGMPVPKVLCYGEDLSDTFRPVSILMTRLPGWPLNNSSAPFVAEEEETWLNDLGKCLHAMRKWKSPFKDKQICSAIGTPISTQRVPGHAMGPFKTQKELHEYLLSPASTHGFKSLEEFQMTMTRARKTMDMPHNIVFTHGDLKAHNVLVDENYCLSGLIDWESAGWCPEYWDFTSAMRFGRGSWWYNAMSTLGGNQYMTELDCDRALNNLTVDSYIM
ncbi:hypothetical protein MMC07_005649 [Pseudocyphellaria aurata]|nr:hypothetical protein [Pseudocyphellaria aurata]